MSRALGDLMGYREAGISADPTIVEHKVGVNDKFLLLCSDGVWEFMCPDDVTKQVLGQDGKSFPQGKDLADVAYHLAQEAHERWLAEEEDVADDITVLMINLHPPRCGQTNMHSAV